MGQFQTINRGYNSTFQYGELSIGIVVPIENYANSAVPTMQDHLRKAVLVDLSCWAD